MLVPEAAISAVPPTRPPRSPAATATSLQVRRPDSVAASPSRRIAKAPPTRPVPSPPAMSVAATLSGAVRNISDTARPSSPPCNGRSATVRATSARGRPTGAGAKGCDGQARPAAGCAGRPERQSDERPGRQAIDGEPSVQDGGRRRADRALRREVERQFARDARASDLPRQLAPAQRGGVPGEIACRLGRERGGRGRHAEARHDGPQVRRAQRQAARSARGSGPARVRDRGVAPATRRARP